MDSPKKKPCWVCRKGSFEMPSQEYSEHVRLLHPDYNEAGQQPMRRKMVVLDEHRIICYNPSYEPNVIQEIQQDLETA